MCGGGSRNQIEGVNFVIDGVNNYMGNSLRNIASVGETLSARTLMPLISLQLGGSGG